MNNKKLITWLIYGIIFGLAMYGIYKMIDSFKTEYMEPETMEQVNILFKKH